MKTVQLHDINSISGKPIQGAEGKPINIKEFLDLFLFQIPTQTLKLEDSVKAQNYFLQIAKQNGNRLKVEDSEYDWVKSMIEKHGHLMAGLNVIKVKEAWDDLLSDEKV